MNVGPLDVLVVVAIQVLEFELNVGFPGNVGLINCYLLIVRVTRESVGVVEHGLGNETAREGSGIRVQGLAIDRRWEAQILVGLDGIAVVELVHGQFIAHELLVGARLDVSAMVLVEVV